MNISWPIDNLSNKQLILIPIILAAILGSAVAYNWSSTGNPVPLSLEFSGGSYIRVNGVNQLGNDDLQALKVDFQNEFNTEPPDVRMVDATLEIETSAD